MRAFKKFISLFLAVVTIISCFATTSVMSFAGEARKQKTGWVYLCQKTFYSNGVKVTRDLWEYYDADGEKVDWWQKIDGYWYFFNDGVACSNTDYCINNGDTYYRYCFNSKAQMITNSWYYDKAYNKWFYARSDGRCISGDWGKIDNKWYYFTDYGNMVYDCWRKVAGCWYHFDSNGVMQTGWLKDKGKWYYLSSSGKMVVSNWVKYNNNWYYFDENGVMIANKGEYIKGKIYYFNSSGACTNP